MPKHQPHEYVAIKLWGIELGSYPYYIKDQQAKASREGAPVDALYFCQPTHAPAGSADRWICVSDLKDNHPFRKAYEAHMAVKKLHE